MKKGDLKKNFIPLSKVAKEKKYAQEYLGLLARRGDLGSIRIGKRWYTTEEWFSEFLCDAEAKKAEMKIAKNQAGKINTKVNQGIEVEKIFVPHIAEFREKEFSAAELPEKLEIRREAEMETGEIIKKNFSVVNNFEKKETNRDKTGKASIPLKREVKFPAMSAPKRAFESQMKLKTIDLRNIAKERITRSESIPTKKNKIEKNIYREYEPESAALKEDAFREWKFRSKNVSPNFSDAIPAVSFFRKFAFSTAAVLSLVLIFQLGLIFRNDLRKKANLGSGIVAGAEDDKAGIGAAKSYSAQNLENQGDKVKENFSFSRVMIKAAMEKDVAQKPVSSD
ncbi:MAG: hypothetical protein WC831_04420 [Parcubacteria group bacterium]|jgi:hypothetical protein